MLEKMLQGKERERPLVSGKVSNRLVQDKRNHEYGIRHQSQTIQL